MWSYTYVFVSACVTIKNKWENYSVFYNLAGRNTSLSILLFYFFVTFFGSPYGHPINGEVISEKHVRLSTLTERTPEYIPLIPVFTLPV